MLGNKVIDRSKSKSPEKQTNKHEAKKKTTNNTNNILIQSNLNSLKTTKTNDFQKKSVYVGGINIKNPSSILKENLNDSNNNKLINNHSNAVEDLELDQYKFDEIDFSTNNSHENDNKIQTIIKEETAEKEENIDEQISIESDNAEETKTNVSKNRYFDIPIKDHVQHINKPQSLFKENMMNYAYDDKQSYRVPEQLYTPPFAKFKPLKFKFETKELPQEDIFKDMIQKKPRALMGEDEHLLDLIYDHVLGCYYDPKTEIYYELRNK